MSVFGFSGNQELKYLPGGGPKMAILSQSPLACPCRTIGLPVRSGEQWRGRQHIFFSLMKKQIILTGHVEKENSFLPVVTIKSSQAFPH